MAQVNLNLQGITEDDLLRDANIYKTGLTGNVAVSGTSPTLAEYEAMIADATAKKAAADAADAAAKNATAAKNASFAALHAGTALLGTSVQTISKGDPVKISSVGMGIKAASAPVGMLPAVENLSVTGGDFPGSNDLHWDPLPRGVQSYLVQQAATPSGPWTQVYAGKKSSCTVPGNVSGTEYWFQVCAVGAAGPGPWGNRISKRAT